MIDIKMDMSGLERLEKVLTQIHGNKIWQFDGIADASGVEERDLAQEALQHLITDEGAQKSFLTSRSFSYPSRIAGCRVKARLPQ